MKQQNKRNISWLLMLLMVVSLFFPGTAMETNAKTSKVSYEKQLAAVVSYLRNSVETPTVGNEWVVMTSARFGKVDVNWYRAYYDNLYRSVKENNSASLGKLSDNARAVLALTAMGADPTNVAGKSLLDPLYNHEAVSKEYVTTAIYVLLALQSKDYPTPKCIGSTSPRSLTKLILSNFDSNGGYIGYVYDGVAYDDLDSTAMALQALAPDYASDSEVKAVVDKALIYLSNAQNGDGTYGKGEFADKVCSTAQVITALSSLGIDAANDSRFVKNGKSALEALLSYAKPDGSIVMDGAYNPLMDCEQAAYALVSYDRLKGQETGFYDMTDAEPMFIKLPAKTAIKKVASPVKKQITVTWKKKSGIAGYQLAVSSRSDFKASKTKVYKVPAKDKSRTVKKSLKSRKTYYVRIRTYKTSKVNGVKYTVYSQWSGEKKISVK